jgi:hypothetical protein
MATVDLTKVASSVLSLSVKLLDDAGFDALLASYLTLVCCLSYSSTLKMGASCSSEISVDFQRITPHYISGDKTLLDDGVRQAIVLNFVDSLHDVSNIDSIWVFRWRGREEIPTAMVI